MFSPPSHLEIKSHMRTTDISICLSIDILGIYTKLYLDIEPKATQNIYLTSLVKIYSAANSKMTDMTGFSLKYKLGPPTYFNL